ncbi:MAG TPA: hypothetical protein VLV78_05835 [Thermoanaerobaculia bacterium]|nr:hypothetical protein [Thermoanaerobaculia bacterium]
MAVASAREKELLGYPGVVTVGAGPRRKRGKITGEAAIIVTVRRKLSDGDLQARAQKPLPDRLDGVRIDVVELGAPVEAPEIVAAQERAREVLDTVREEWLKTPNVTGIGIGYKSIKGQTDFNTIALKIFVAHKLPSDELKRRKLTPVPSSIDGVVTDVEEVPGVRPAASASGSRDDRRDPLVGGLTVGVNTKPFWYGTLGAIVFDRTTGEQMVLSNQHVLDGPAGTEVVQPSPIGLDDSLEIGFQLDVCNPLHFFRLDTPNTTVGTILSGAATAALLAAALSDQIDPTRRGQEATPPAPGAKTIFETHHVKLDYPELPIPGTHFKVRTSWEYGRHTDMGDQSYAVEEMRENPHVLVDKILLTDKRLYRPGDTIRLFGLILPEPCAPKQKEREPKRASRLTDQDMARITERPNVTPPSLSSGTVARSSLDVTAVHRCRCDRYHCTAILTPTTVDRAFPVVLHEPLVKNHTDLIRQVIAVVEHLDDKELIARAIDILRYGCLYAGSMTASNIPTGPWKHYLYVQTVNFADETMKPVDAAAIIGGLPVSQNTKPQLDVACGPFVWEDGQFDIELI